MKMIKKIIEKIVERKVEISLKRLEREFKKR